MTKGISAIFAILAVLSLGCDSPKGEAPERLAAQFNFSQRLAERLPANHIETMLKSGDTLDALSTIETEVTVGNQRASITFEIFRLSGIAIDYPDLRFSKTQSWMNAELLSSEEMAERLQSYRESARLVDSKPVVIVRFDDECNVSFLIETALFLERNGITHWGLTESDYRIIEHDSGLNGLQP